jgi:hypothetical protein
MASKPQAPLKWAIYIARAKAVWLGVVGPREPLLQLPPEGEERWECLKCERIVSLKPQEVCSECLWKGRLWIAWLVVLWVCAMKGAADLLWLLLGEGALAQLIGYGVGVGITMGIAVTLLRLRL